MTVEERLLFIRAGYSAQDIAAFEQAEQPEQPEQPAQLEQPAQSEQLAQPEQPAQPEPAWAVALKNSIDEMRKTMQANNRAFDDMGDDFDVETAADNAMQQYLTGKAPEKSNNHGGKRK